MRTNTLDKLLKILFLVLIVSAGFYLLFRFYTLAIFASVAFVLAYLLNPLVNRMQANGLNRTFSIFLVIAGLFLIMYHLSTTVVPPLFDQAVLLGQQLNPDNIRIIARTIDQWTVENIPIIPNGFVERSVVQFINEILLFADVKSKMPLIFKNIYSVVGNVFTAIIIIPMSLFFLLKDGSKIRRGILSLVPNRYFETTLSIIDKTEKRLGLYFRSVILQSIIVMVIASTLLNVAGIQNALLVGIGVGILNIIPYFGPTIGYLIVILFAIFETGDLSLVYAAFLCQMTTQLIDNIILQPLIFSKSSDMHPLSILFIVLIGAEIGGVLGMLFAIPLAATLNLTIKEIRWSLRNYHIFRIQR